MKRFLEEFVRRFLAEGEPHYGLLELACGDAAAPFSFPTFRFRPSQLATWDGTVWTPWQEGHCALVSGADGDAALHDALEECAWGHGVVTLLALTKAELGLLRGGEPVGLETLERLAGLVMTVLAPAHDGEALAIWRAD